MVLTDLDGTLLRPDHSISQQDYDTLVELGARKIVRVIATGRSPFSLRRVVPPDFPIDYIIFSNGAGIYRWRDQSILLQHSLTSEQVATVYEVLQREKVDFMVHGAIPENHRFFYVRNQKVNPDFDGRIALYQEVAAELGDAAQLHAEACMILVIVEAEADYYEALKSKLPEFRVIRTTSPLNFKTLWIEIFPRPVSKALSAEWLCGELKIDPRHTIGIGNDYNDVDLLHWVANGFVVENAPLDLQSLFRVTNHHEDSGFSQAVRRVLAI